jgi:hypothetical protein
VEGDPGLGPRRLVVGAVGGGHPRGPGAGAGAAVLGSGRLALVPARAPLGPVLRRGPLARGLGPVHGGAGELVVEAAPRG